ncbi:acyl-ACP--UDP-N-acetylglucosamine O-acyltransferase [Pseudaminobacter sp. 19-2017]|uniref:Acyl-ACP--UDP-N-acetylglucosamine O-acyltransferase n=1 Tax=Pseudaminobacter soli (ex Zhang et al. 2022) TaxID=2831468 RepID=A0A942I3I6_9HYPH|nr:acyl-ACP--UDP-N-acetylglucosamine O-acyltransferase [Pseudaminobacter soli]MBS3651347.1 acyl-ACP--UDP-N-acetylglucosamine O-acyltransferase [Pseudaminobacter soli]
MTADTLIHPLAVVEPGASIGAGARIGPFCHVGADAVVGDRTTLMSHVVVSGATTIGSDCTVHPQAVLGGAPQSTSHKGGRTTLTIGDRCVIREFVTMNRGTDNSRGATTVGNDGLFMAYVHIAHDCSIGDNATFANGVTLGGHCDIGNSVGIGGLTALHQFVRVGDKAFVAGGSMVLGDVVPYGLASGDRAELRGMNVVGMRRAGVPRSDRLRLRMAYKTLFDRSRTMAENIELVRAEFADSPYAMQVIDFMVARGRRSFTLPPLKGGIDDSDDDQE